MVSTLLGEMLTFFSSLLPFVVVVTGGQFLQDWSIDTQTSDMASSGPVLKNGIPNTSGLALATADGSSEFAQPPPNRGDVVSSDGIVVQGGSGCSSNTITHPRRIRARDEMKCPTNLFRPNGEEEKERNLLHFTPDAQENGGGQNTGGSGDPERRLAIPPEDSKLPYLFIPEEDRPKENLELCPEATYPVPVCGNPRDTYVSSYLYPNQLIIDPCYRCMSPFHFFHFSGSEDFYLFDPIWFFLNFFKFSQHDNGVLMLKDIFLREDIVLVGCLSIEGGRTGYCCKRAEVAYGYVCAFLPKLPPSEIITRSSAI